MDSYLSKFASDLEIAFGALRAIEAERQTYPDGSPGAQAGADASEKAHAILRRGMADVRRFPVEPANLNDRWAILKLAVDAFGLADPDVASLAGIVAVEAGLAVQAEAMAAAT
ncbi:hypothetical protein CKO39_07860 [Rhodopseudomonas palustris]|nr:hypothetical protein CKO39_07860 [Rhodopseudomonas palustris]